MLERESFIDHLETERRLSKHTVISYKTDLDQFFLAMGENLAIQDIDTRDIKNWMIHLSNQGLSPTSINRKIACLRTFFSFLLRKGLIQKNILKGIKAQKTPKRLPHFIRESESIPLFSKEWAEDFDGMRRHLILLLFYGTGMRLSELIEIKESDIDYFESTIKVLGKRNKERIIPVPKALMEIIQKYRSVKPIENPYLLITDKGEKLYPVFVQRLIKQELAGIKNLEKKSPHVLRHTYATHLLNQGADLNAIKELLGHSNLAATQVYTHNSLDKIKSIYDQAHPRSRKSEE